MKPFVQKTVCNVLLERDCFAGCHKLVVAIDHCQNGLVRQAGEGFPVEKFLKVSPERQQLSCLRLVELHFFFLLLKSIHFDLLHTGYQILIPDLKLHTFHPGTETRGRRETSASAGDLSALGRKTEKSGKVLEKVTRFLPFSHLYIIEGKTGKEKKR